MASIMELPARPSAAVMFSPLSASERVMRCAASLTLADTISLTEPSSWASAGLHVADRGADLIGLADQRLALAGEILDQAADARLVVVVGALERADFLLHQRFEFAGAGERALDAVAHRRQLRGGSPGRSMATESPAMVSGSARRSATSVIDCEIRRNSCARTIM